MSTNIRASMLPGYVDCPRRAAAKQFRQEFKAAGYTFRDSAPSVGAAVGTAVHAAAAFVLQSKIQTGTLGSTDAGIEMAIKAFREETDPGVQLDNTTPNRAVAEDQIVRLTHSYVFGVAGHINPTAVEQAWKCDAGDGFELTGHCDVLTVEGVIRDLKTGALIRPYQSQLGGYALLARSQTLPVTITGVAIDFIRRTPRTKPQDPPVSKTYDQAVAERAAFATIQRIKADMAAFRKTGDPWSFPANPMSMMCRPQFCPAHGTDFCDLGRDD